MFFASIAVSARDEDLLTGTSRAGASPFAIMLQHAGWKHGPDLINAFIFIATFSASNSSIYIASRTLKALADQGRAPKFLSRTHFRGVPVYAVIASNLVGLIGLTTISEGGGKVFGYLTTLIGAGSLIAWSLIGITHLRFRKAWRLQGFTEKDLPFKAFLYPYGTWAVVIFNPFLVIIQGYATLVSCLHLLRNGANIVKLTPWHPVDFVFSYVILVLFVILTVFWKLYHKTKLVDLSTVNLQEGRREVLTQDDDEEKPGLTHRAMNALRSRLSSS
jgi:yeast amino acid transporter